MPIGAIKPIDKASQSISGQISQKSPPVSISFTEKMTTKSRIDSSSKKVAAKF